MKVKAIGIRKRSKPKIYEADFSSMTDNLPEPFQLVNKKKYEKLLEVEKVMIERESENQDNDRDEQINE